MEERTSVLSFWLYGTVFFKETFQSFVS